MPKKDSGDEVLRCSFCNKSQREVKKLIVEPSGATAYAAVAEGRADTEPKIVAESRIGSVGVFSTLHIPLLSGEMCRDDSNVSAMMVNRSFANTYFRDTSVIGKHLGQPSSLYFPSAVVRGIVGDARERGLDHEPVPTIYYCGLIMQPGLNFMARTHGDPMALE